MKLFTGTLAVDPEIALPDLGHVPILKFAASLLIIQMFMSWDYNFWDSGCLACPLPFWPEL